LSFCYYISDHYPWLCWSYRQLGGVLEKDTRHIKR